MKSSEIEFNDSDAPEQVRESRTNMIYDILIRIEQVVFSRTTCSTEPVDVQTLLVRAARTCLRENNWRVIEYFAKHGCASGYILIRKLGMARNSVYDALGVLHDYGLINAVTKLPPTTKRKKRAVLWGWFDSTEKQALTAVSLYNRLTDPLYMKAEKLAMDYMEKVVIKEGLSEVRYPQILQYLRENRVSSMDIRVFGEVAIKTLKENGVKVWQ